MTKLFSQPKSFLWTKIFFRPIILWTQIFFGPRYYSDPKFFLDTTFLFTLNLCWTQNTFGVNFFKETCFGHKLFWPINFWDSKFFGPDMLFGPNFLFNAEFLGQKNVKGTKIQLNLNLECGAPSSACSSSSNTHFCWIHCKNYSLQYLLHNDKT